MLHCDTSAPCGHDWKTVLSHQSYAGASFNPDYWSDCFPGLATSAGGQNLRRISAFMPEMFRSFDSYAGVTFWCERGLSEPRSRHELRYICKWGCRSTNRRPSSKWDAYHRNSYACTLYVLQQCTPSQTANKWGMDKVLPWHHPTVRMKNWHMHNTFRILANLGEGYVYMYTART